ncbi:site-specific integrase [Uliginosibacterium aquaticum]|uniref:Site-specific integrase n=1 Tax=Uliginosibacterium aquaticum TaxID=2731212 RepID=A0ABX2IEK9_9RHOO|nr:site-specific integrase [Uliginosibacterium aquaticum]NSL54562.1 site-specific integrase [Uliginosibacterium aquaticum]
MPMLPTGLQRHPKSGSYYLRRRIPTDILACYPGKKEITFSLRTKDYRTAVERHREEEARLTAEWSAKRQAQASRLARQHLQVITRIDALTPETIDAICLHAEAASLAGDEARRESGTYTLEEIEDYQSGYAEANRVLKSAVAIGDYELLRRPLEQFLQLYRYQLKASDAEMRRLSLAYGRMAIRTNDKLLSRYEGKDEPTPQLARRLDTPMLSEVTQNYLEYYKKLGKTAMLRKVSAVMPLLVDIVGDKPIGSLTQTDLEAYFEAVQTLPPRWKDICRQEKLSPRELATQGRGEMSKGTFDGTYLAVMTPFIRYCRRKWQDHGWPMTLTSEGVQYIGKRRDAEGGQRAFAPEELKRLFEGKEMAAFARDPASAHQYWLPHLGLFTGARVNELCQLNPQIDILQDARTGTWYLDITPESEGHANIDKSVKTAGSKRKLPLHPKLIELGFLDYVAAAKARGDTLLFQAFPASAGRASPKAADWFRKFLGEIDLRDETPNARIVGMHAFRSTLLNRAMVLGVVNAEAITGHVSNVTSLEKVQDGQVERDASAVVKKYRGELPVDKKLEILTRITFPEVSFIRPSKP